MDTDVHGLRAVVAEAAPGVVVVRDTCNVYVLRDGDEAVVIDFGAGRVLDLLAELGVSRITDVLLTHHHRDQVQGLARAVRHGARIWSPPYDAALVSDVDRYWQSRPFDIDYDLTEDRFSLLEEVPITGTVAEYRSRRYGGVDVFTLPTPGHTLGSVTYVVERDGRRIGFVGDLVHADGRLWSLAATQWTYTGIEGLESSIVSLARLEQERLDLLLPSHGGTAEIGALRARLGELVRLRAGDEWGLEGRLSAPFEHLTEHLWRNRATYASSYVLVSAAGRCLGIDFGYDQATWRRPLLWSLEGLAVDAVITTHYHDDHVAGLNLLRDARGAQVWAPANVAPVLEEPHRYDLPCLWREPIPVDRVVPLDEPFRWEEYELTLYAFPGHTLYAAAISFEVDGVRVLATGDQYATEAEKTTLNYQYRNRFGRRDYVQTGALLRRLRPDLLVSGHWLPRRVDEAFHEEIERDAETLARLHDEILPEDGLGDEGFAVRIEPYRCTVAAGAAYELAVTVRNPFARPETAQLRLDLPGGWTSEPAEADLQLEARCAAAVRFRVSVGDAPTRRARIGADLTVGGVPFGHQAEALVDVE